MGRRKGIFGRSKDKDAKHDRKKSQQQQTSTGSTEDVKASPKYVSSSSKSSSNHTSQGRRRRSSSFASLSSDVTPPISLSHHENNSPEGIVIVQAEVDRNNDVWSDTTSTSIYDKEISGASRNNFSSLPAVSENKPETHSSNAEKIRIPVKHLQKQSESQSQINMRSTTDESFTTPPQLKLPVLEKSRNVPENMKDQHQHANSSLSRYQDADLSQQAHIIIPSIPPSFITSDEFAPHLGPMSNMFVTRLPPVNIAIQQLWNVDVNDFSGGLRALRVLNRSIQSEGIVSRDGIEFTSYDPSELFMCVQNNADRYRSRWEELKREQAEKENTVKLRENAQKIRDKQQFQPELNSDVKIHPHGAFSEEEKIMKEGTEHSEHNSGSFDSASKSNFSADSLQEEHNYETSNESSTYQFPNYDPIDEKLWLQLESIAWEIWDNSLQCITSLAKACVGPAWFYQLQQRRLRIASKQDIITQQGLDRSNHTISTIGLDSYTNSSRQGFRGFVPPDIYGPIEEELQDSPSSSTGTNPQSAASGLFPALNSTIHNNKRKYPAIPEVLPAAMLRFAAHFGDSIVSTIHEPESLIHLTLNNDKHNNGSIDEIDLNDYSDSIMKLVWREQRELIRRQKIGEAQRDVVVALCCPAVEDTVNETESQRSSRSDNGTTSSGNVGSDSSRIGWSIPGAHAPVATMIRVWAETAVVGWPDAITEIEMVDENIMSENEEGRLPRVFNDFVINPSSPRQVEIKWRSIFKRGSVDWWYSYQVTKTVCDLATTGWRPPPSGKDGVECTLRLVNLAEKGIILDSRDMKCPNLDTVDVAREERIAAASSAAEALATLSRLGSSGCIPIATVSFISSSLCRLLAAADSSISGLHDTDLFPIPAVSSEEEEEALLGEQGAFIAQRESSLKDIAELMWTMLSHPSSMTQTSKSLLNVIVADITSGMADKVSKLGISDGLRSRETIGAIRALGASLWGNPPQVTGIPSLRSYWDRFLRFLAEITSALHDWSSCDISPLARPTVMSSSSSLSSSFRRPSNVDSRGIENFKSIPKLAKLSEYATSSLVLVLEVAIAFRRLVDGEMKEGTANLSPHEWHPFISLLELGLLPWLPYSNIDDTASEKSAMSEVPRNDYLVEKIQSEVHGIFNQIQMFLIVRDDNILALPRIVDEYARRRILLLYFRMISPLLRFQDSDFVNTSVIQSWVCGGAITHRGFDWQKKCSDVLVESFAVYEDRSNGFPRGYVHSSLIRITAIRSFVDTNNSSASIESNQLSHMPISPLDLDPNHVARYARNIHLELVCSVMFPFLSEILLRGTQRHGLVLQNPMHVRPPSDEARCDVENRQQDDEYLLQKTAIQIVGDFLMSDTVEKRRKNELIGLLREFMDNGHDNFSVQSLCTNDGTVSQHNEITEHIEESLSPFIALKLEVVRQLGLFFEATFKMVDQLHSFVPLTVQVLTNIVASCNSNVSTSVPISGNCLVSLAAMTHLSRLSLDRSNRAMILNESSIFRSLPSSTVRTLLCVRELVNKISSSHRFCDIQVNIPKEKDFEIDGDVNDFVASFVKIDTNGMQDSESLNRNVSRSRRLGTSLDVQPLLDVIKVVLNETSQRNEKDGNLKSCALHCFVSEIRTLSYEILSGFVLCDIIKSPIQQWVSKIPANTKLARQSEMLSRCKFLCRCASFAISSIDDEGTEILFKEMIDCCSSENVVISSHGCRALSILLSLSALSSNSISDHNSKEIEKDRHNSIFMSWGQESCNTLLELIQSKANILEIGAIGDIFEREICCLLSLLSALYDILSAYQSNFVALNDRLKARTVILCIQICSANGTAHIHLLCLQCTATAISSMAYDEIEKLLSHVAERRSVFRDKMKVEESEYIDIIFDLLIQRNRELHESKHECFKNTHGDSKILLSANECIAKEYEEIESFVGGQDNFTSAAWHYGDMILTCRIGSRESRYRGWVELISRSSCARTRRVVRLSRHVSLSNPNFPSPLWDKLMTEKSRRDVMSIPYDYNETLHVDTKVVSLAKDAMNRFRNSNPRQDHFSRKITSSSINSDNFRSSMSLEPSEKTMKRSLSAGDLDTDLSNHKEQVPSVIGADSNNIGIDSYVRKFLTEVLHGNEDFIREVESEINTLDGANSSVLDSFYAHDEEVIQLKSSSQLRRAVAILDRTAFVQTHKIALLFLGAPGPGKEEWKGKGKDAEILSATLASPSFSKFCSGLGEIISLPHLRHFSGGLDTSDYASDGKFALSWLNRGSGETCDLTGKSMVLFHSVPLMPPGLNNRKRHVGNDVVHIVYLEDPKTSAQNVSDRLQSCDISGEFCFVTIFVTPSIHHADMMKVTTKIRKNLDKEVMTSLHHLSLTDALIPNAVAPFYVRQIAIRADLSCRSAIQDRLGLYSNWQERLRQIRELKRYVVK